MSRIPRSGALVFAVILVAVVALLYIGVTPKKPRAGAVPAPPQDVSVTMNFQGGPNLVFLCWAHKENDVNFYDVGVESFSDGQPRFEVRYGVTTTSCGEALGTGEYMFTPDLYHFSVRACNNTGCSDWADASSGDRYWFGIPCTDPIGNSCARPENLSAGR